MVMIPTDVGIQVRNQTEPGTHPVRAIGDIPSDLPELIPGQVFRARIQEVLPENSYKAVVAGRLLTLSLPEGAKAGDTLELVVVGRTPRAIVAQRSELGGGAVAPFDNSSLSRTGQLIASLLGPEGEAPQPARLTQGGAVLAKVPVNGAEIARDLPAGLSKAVAGSGMFYEAHQVQWALGQRPLASLLAEPQGRFSRPVSPGQLGAEPVEVAALAVRRDVGGTAAARELQAAIPGRESLPVGLTDADAPTGQEARPITIPDELRPLVQQQLEAGATHRLAWQGEIWPNQTMDWEIRRDDSGAGEIPEAQDLWQTRLRLELPRLGEIEVRLQLGGTNVNVMIGAASGNSGDLLQAALPALQQSFAASGLTLAGAQVKNGPE